MGKAIIDGVVFRYGKDFYNIFREPNSGRIISRVSVGDLLFSWYDVEQAEAARAEAYERISEYEACHLMPPTDTNLIPELEVVPILEVENELAQNLIIIGAAY